MSDPVTVELTQEEFTEALVMFAAYKSGMKYPLRHKLDFNGSMMLMGRDDSDRFLTITLEHLENVVPIGKPR